MKPRFRFTLGGTSISDPKGWNDVVLNLERDLGFHSLVENIDTPFEFYGRTASKDGGYARIKQARDNGPDSQVTLIAQVSWDRGVTYDTFFNGQLDLTTLKDVEIRGKRTFQCTILRDDLWSKFINRKSIPVDVLSPTGIDGGALSVLTPKTLSLPSQKIHQSYQGNHIDDVTYTTISGTTIGQVDFIIDVYREIEEKFDIPRVAITEPAAPLFTVRYAGDYTIICDITLSTGLGPSGAGSQNVPVDYDVVIDINDGATVVAFSKTNVGVGGVNRRTEFSYSDTLTLEEGDEIRIYITNSGASSTIVWLDFYNDQLTVETDTTFTDSSCEAFPIHDIGMAIGNRIIGSENTFYSEYFGGTSATSRTYGADGCGLNFLTMLGAHVRGFTLAEKPYSQSFEEWWDCWNPIFNLGLGYEYVGTTEVIRVEEKEHFYDDSSQSIILEGVQGIEIGYDPDYFYTSIEVGYEKWDVESKSGVDDPQTVHTYATRFKTIGSAETKDINILSKAYAASLGIEQTRRNSLEPNKDWKLDDDFIVIQSDLSTSPAEPVLYSNSVITGLENADTRYNVRLTPASNLNRWKEFLAIGFSDYTSDFFKFVRGEGNTAMTYNDPTAVDCDAEAGTVAIENGDILIGPDFLFQAVLYTFTHPLTWNQYKGLRDYPKKSFAVRYYDNDGVHQQAVAFVKKLAYKPNESKADFQVWIKSVSQV